VLPLSSCIFFFSAFSPLLTQVVARTDLSSVIPSGAAKDYAVYCVTAYAPPQGEFVLLMNRNASVDPRVIVLDSSLNLIQTYTSAQLNGWGAFSGSTIMEEADQNIEIGNFGFSATNLLTVGASPSWNANQSVFGPSFSSPLRQKNVINFQVTGVNVLTYSQWQWWTTNNFNAAVAIKSTADTQFQVDAVYNIEDSLSAGRVILVLGEQGSSTMHIVALPLAAVCTNTLLPALFDNYPHASYSNLDSSSVGFAGDCLVAYSYQDHALVRYSLTPPFGVLSTLPVGQGAHQITYAYKADGSYSVQLDQSTRMLTKVARWW
ncbi:MAG: hypothetical protein ABSG63_22140, partial [Spirochaetia bacterium]